MEEMNIFTGRPKEAEPFIIDFKNYNHSMEDKEKIQWFTVVVALNAVSDLRNKNGAPGKIWRCFSSKPMPKR